MDQTTAGHNVSTAAPVDIVVARRCSENYSQMMADPFEGLFKTENAKNKLALSLGQGRVTDQAIAR